ncbi:MAG: hypothetical protein WA701_01920, partial [Solirubrobacterales bacterium]
LQDGASAEQVAAYLGHKDANVTRAVYLHVVKDAERAAGLRGWQTKEFGSLFRTRNGETDGETDRAASRSSEATSATAEEAR